MNKNQKNDLIANQTIVDDYDRAIKDQQCGNESTNEVLAIFKIINPLVKRQKKFVKELKAKNISWRKDIKIVFNYGKWRLVFLLERNGNKVKSTDCNSFEFKDCIDALLMKYVLEGKF